MIKILIVEDDPEISKMLQTLLTKHHYEVKCAFSGTEAILLLKKESFDWFWCKDQIKVLSMI